MKLELNVPSSQVAAIETIIKVICSNETGKQLSVESCLDDSKLMGFRISPQLLTNLETFLTIGGAHNFSAML